MTPLPCARRLVVRPIAAVRGEAQLTASPSGLQSLRSARVRIRPRSAAAALPRNALRSRLCLDFEIFAVYDDPIRKADVLIEAMGWIRRFRDRLLVVKLGGSALEDPQTVSHLLTDMIF